MADFNKIQSHILKSEGGYAFLKGDSGGETYKGIARNYNPNWTGWAIIDSYKPQYPNGIPNNTVFKNSDLDNSVNAYYKANYWDPIGGDKIKNDSIALLIYDMSVNQGVGKTAKIVGDSLGTVSTIPFTKTVDKINAADQQALFNTIKQKREEHYKSLGGNFLQGWLNRLNKISFVGNTLPTILLAALLIISSIYILKTK